MSLKIHESMNFYAEYMPTKEQKKEFRKERNARRMYLGLKMTCPLRKLYKSDK